MGTEETEESAEPMELEIIGTDELAANSNEQASAVSVVRSVSVPGGCAAAVLDLDSWCTQLVHCQFIWSLWKLPVPATVTSDPAHNEYSLCMLHRLSENIVQRSADAALTLCPRLRCSSLSTGC